jgi:GNAT superfamily N-acetyltransferase
MTSTTTPIPTRKVTPGDLDQFVETLATAFFDDPVVAWAYPAPDRRRELLPAFFQVAATATLPGGGLYTTADGNAAALWVPSDATLDEAAMAAELVRRSAEYGDRVATLLELLEDTHPTQEEHQYLFLLGTRPQWQSRGLGSALLRAVLERCDADGMPAYLEATSERNVPLYQRHGFAVTQQITLPDGPPLWCMWRTPRP